MNLFVITGRRHGDDEDIGQHIWADNEDVAIEQFRASFFDSDNESYSEDLIYINYTLNVGSQAAQGFILNASLHPAAANDDATDEKIANSHEAFIRSFGPIVIGDIDGPVNYEDVKDQSDCNVWTVVDEHGDHETYIQAGRLVNDTVVGYVVTMFSWQKGNERYRW